ncbi:MAG: filamentous hemagglutinin N-terminal domain-containing protein [Cyanobacteria bacterium P01_F01_bin.143]
MSQTSKASAQITPDVTLPSNSIVSSDANGDLITITGGTNTGNNLFHSFQEFSVLVDQTAFFDNPLTIENIFSRVTGDSISNIEGILRANGTANLFLINPNGIIFGSDASLNIGGSFLGSTADSIQFSDGSFYSAVNPQTPPLLEINIPIGLQYGSNAGNIIVSGSGNSTGFTDAQNNDLSLIKDFRPAGLQVPQGNSLALIGGNIALDGGNLTAAAGHIELGSVTEGLVKLDSDTWVFDYQEVAGFKDIALVNAASVEVSGNSSGTINVQGQNITLSDASAILSNTSGDGTAGSISLNGIESVQVTGISQNDIPFVSYVSTGTTFGSTGEGADLNINTNYLLVAGGAIVDSPVFGSGDGGDINVKAEQIELIAGSPIAGSSGLISPIVPGATGEGGDINVTTDSLLVAGGAQAFTLSVSSSQAGDFNIDAQTIELTGTSPNGTPSGLFSNTFANGDGGNLTIETDSLLVTNGADIAATVSGEGTAGNVTIQAENIELSGLFETGRSGQISTSVIEGATGFGGDITIDTNSLILTNGIQINASVFGSGEGGNINITAQEIDLIGVSPANNVPSAIFAAVFPGATGNSGNVTIMTDKLRVSEGAQIAVSTAGSGSAGNLTLAVSDSVELIGNAIADNGGSSGLFSSAVFGEGNGGNIDLTTNHLIIKDGATISASNFLSGNADVPPGRGIGGNININAQTIELDGVDSDTSANITAATFAGGGGNILLNSNTITATNGAQITADTSGAGDSGSIAIATEEFNLSNQAQVSVNSTGLGQAGDIAIASDSLTLDEGSITATSTETGGGDISLVTDSIFLNNNSLISTSVLNSFGGGGNIFIDNSGFIIGQNNSDIKANAVFGPGGNIQINAQGLFFDLDSEITASSKFGVDGVVEINNLESINQIGVTLLDSEILDGTRMFPSLCPTSSKNVMIISGKGGLGNNPSQTLRGQSFWEDLRDFSQANNDHNLNSPTGNQGSNQNTETIIEANNWIVNAQGNTELISHIPLSFNQCKK